MRRRSLPLASAFALLQACAEEATTPGACDPGALEPGEASATLDGAAWSSAATWVWQGDSLQLNTTSSGGWRFTLVAQEAGDGSTARAAVEAGALPVEVALAVDGGGWGLAYPDDGPSLTTDQGGGALTLVALADDVLEACFELEAASSSGDRLRAEGGLIRALPFQP